MECVVCCKNQETMFRCKACNDVVYCSEKCQTLDWGNKHKNICATVATDRGPQSLPKFTFKAKPQKTTATANNSKAFRQYQSAIRDWISNVKDVTKETKSEWNKQLRLCGVSEMRIDSMMQQFEEIKKSYVKFINPLDKEKDGVVENLAAGVNEYYVNLYTAAGVDVTEAVEIERNEYDSIIGENFAITIVDVIDNLSDILPQTTVDESSGTNRENISNILGGVGPLLKAYFPVITQCLPQFEKYLEEKWTNDKKKRKARQLKTINQQIQEYKKYNVEGEDDPRKKNIARAYLDKLIELAYDNKTFRKTFEIIFFGLSCWAMYALGKKTFVKLTGQTNDVVKQAKSIYTQVMRKGNDVEILVNEANKDIQRARTALRTGSTAAKNLSKDFSESVNPHALVERRGLIEAKLITIEVLRARKQAILDRYGSENPEETAVALFVDKDSGVEPDTLDIGIKAIDDQAIRVNNANTEADLIKQVKGVQALIMGTTDITSHVPPEKIEALEQQIAISATVLSKAGNKLANAMEKLSEYQANVAEVALKAEQVGGLSTYEQMIDFVSKKTGSPAMATFFDGWVASPLGVLERTFKRMSRDPKFGLIMNTLGTGLISANVSNIAAILGEYGGALFISFIQIQSLLGLAKLLGYIIGGAGTLLEKLGKRIATFLVPEFEGKSFVNQMDEMNAGITNISKTAKGTWFVGTLVSLMGKGIKDPSFAASKMFGMIQWWGTLVLGVVSALSFLSTISIGATMGFSILPMMTGVVAWGTISVVGIDVAMRTFGLILWLIPPKWQPPGGFVRVTFCIQHVTGTIIGLGVGSLLGYSMGSDLMTAASNIDPMNLNIYNVFGLVTK